MLGPFTVRSRPRILALSLLIFATTCARRPAPPRLPPPPPGPSLLTFTATAYSIAGRTASGHYTRKGIVAADPRVLPLGSRIRIHESGGYDGEYEVRDTGRGIKGHELDIYLVRDDEAKRFGRRRVKVEVLDRGRR